MTAILVILLVAIGVAFWKRNQLGDKANMVLGGLVALALLSVILRVASSGRPRTTATQVQSEFYQAAGAKLGAAIAAAHPEGGTVLVIHPGSSGAVLDKINQARVVGLKKGFGGGNYQIVESGPKTEAEMEAMFAFESQLPLTELLRYLEQAPDARVIVSMVGAPENLRGAARPIPPMYLFENVDRVMAEDMMRAGLIRGAVLYKDDADWKAPIQRGMTEDEIFNLRYELLTAR